MIIRPLVSSTLPDQRADQQSWQEGDLCSFSLHCEYCEFTAALLGIAQARSVMQRGRQKQDVTISGVTSICHSFTKPKAFQVISKLEEGYGSSYAATSTGKNEKFRRYFPQSSLSRYCHRLMRNTTSNWAKNNSAFLFRSPLYAVVVLVLVFLDC